MPCSLVIWLVLIAAILFLTDYQQCTTVYMDNNKKWQYRYGCIRWHSPEKPEPFSIPQLYILGKHVAKISGHNFMPLYPKRSWPRDFICLSFYVSNIISSLVIYRLQIKRVVCSLKNVIHAFMIIMMDFRLQLITNVTLVIVKDGSQLIMHIQCHVRWWSD